MKIGVKKHINFSNRSDHRTFRYFNVMYGLALIAVAVVTISSYILVQHITSQQENDSNVVNVAGRQRMLSQQISKIALQITNKKTGKENVDALKTSYRVWSKYHIALLEGEQELNLPDKNSKEVERMFNNIQPSYLKMKQGVEGIIIGIGKGDMSDLSINKTLILENENDFLEGMDLIVFQYAKEAKDRLDELRQLETILLSIVLFTLFLEVIFIFNPVGKKIKSVITDLVESEGKLKGLANELKEANASLKKSSKDVHDINFALNEATILVRVDREGKIIYANEKYCAITKYSISELMGKMLFENNMGGEESIVYDHIRNEERCRTVWQGEIYDHAKDHTFFWMDVTLIPIITIEGELHQYLVICSDVTKRKETEQELRKLNEAKLLKQQHEQKIRSISMITGQERERKRMSQEVHDGLGQMLTALKFGMESLSGKDEKETERVTNLKDLLHHTIKEVRRISSDLLPTVLQDYGLSAALKELVTISDNGTEGNIIYEDQLRLDRKLDKNVEITLYRICQESIHNALKYSQAENISVKLTNDIEFINLVIEDDGVGFDTEKVSKTSRTKDSGNGLNNIKERAELINGKLYINSQPKKGTIIFVELALKEDIFTEDLD